MKLALLGDIGQFGRFSVNENDNLKEYFEDVSNLLSECDVVVGNLETPFSKNSKPYGAKSAHILSEPENVEILKFLNISHVNLANNHIFDFGYESYKLTQDTLSSAGIDYFGVEDKQCFVEKEGLKLAFHGYCSHNTNPQKITFSGNVGINGLDIDIVKKRMKSNHENGFFNILSIHSGQEHVNFPSIDDINMARAFSEVSPYVYYGHHPHVIQPVEKFNDSVIAYSLGNFCFSDVYTSKSEQPLIKLSENNKTGLILLIEMNNLGVVSHECVPIYMGVNKMEVGTKSTLKDLNGFNSKLKLTEELYNIMRNNIINQYINSRRELRDFNWYLKRLNFGSIRQVINSKLNILKYQKHIKAKLEDNE